MLFGVRGDLKTRSDSLRTHFEAPVGEHSAKPDEFYDVVREASYLPAGEAFQRTARDGFVNVYARAIPGDTDVTAELCAAPLQHAVISGGGRRE